jgi:hypothetical protein
MCVGVCACVMQRNRERKNYCDSLYDSLCDSLYGEVEEEKSMTEGE